MKKMKRLVAVLLAAVMALAMLTACGGGGSGSGSSSIEAKALSAMNTVLGTSYGNNSNLKAKVRTTLQKMDADGRIKVSDLPYVEVYGQKMYCMSDYTYNANTGDVSMIYYVLTQDDANGSNVSSVRAIEVTDAILKQMEDAERDESITDTKAIEAIGVATYTASNSKTYIGFAIKVTGNAYAQ